MGNRKRPRKKKVQQVAEEEDKKLSAKEIFFEFQNGTEDTWWALVNSLELGQVLRPNNARNKVVIRETEHRFRRVSSG